MKTNFILNPFVLYRAELDKLCKAIKQEIAKIHTTEMLEVYYEFSKECVWLGIAVAVADSTNWGRRILIFLPPLHDGYDFETKEAPAAVSLSFVFFNSYDKEIHIGEIDNQLYPVSFLIDESFLKELVKFLFTYKKVNENVFMSKQLSVQ